jgi:photosystem II stability/assembly factor-like uncharacterized protein
MLASSSSLLILALVLLISNPLVVAEWIISSYQPPSGVTFHAVDCHQQVCFAVGGSGSVVRSMDGGKHWTTVPMNTTKQLTSVAVLPSNRVVVGGHNGYYAHLTGSGTLISGGSRPFGVTYAIEDMQFFNSTNGVAVSGYTKYWRTINGGLAWQAVTIAGANQYTQSIDCLKEEEKGNSHCLIGTYKGQVWIKRNSSNLWDKRASANTLLNAGDYATAMYANGAQNLFAIVYHGGWFILQ